MDDDDRFRSTVAITDLVSSYTRTGDTGREEEFSALFADDGVFEIGERRAAKGADAIAALMADVKHAFSLAPAGFFPARHHVSSLNVRFDDADHASGRSYFLLVGGWGPDHWGIYRDRFVREGAQWRFSYRRATMEGAVARSPMAFLLGDDPWPS
jgi:hypothetical protein